MYLVRVNRCFTLKVFEEIRGYLDILFAIARMVEPIMYMQTKLP